MPVAVTDTEDNLWSKILDDVQSRSSSVLPQASVLVLGDNESGKTSLIAHLRHQGDPKRGAGLEYHFLDVNPDYKDGTYAYQLGSALPDLGPGESARLGVWILDGDACHESLMKFALKSAPTDKCLAVLCASMAHPWSVLDSLEKWANMLRRQAENQQDFSRRDALDRQVRFWQEYVEPLDSSTHSTDGGAKVPSMEPDSAQILLPLGEHTLTSNIGIPLIVVITKCDSIAALEKDYDYKDEHLDFIQSHVRRFCLRYGAALVYTSVKEGRNCDLLYKYLLHRLFGFPFTQPALVVERDCIFIPAGWDNEKKISILHENLLQYKPDQPYYEVIQKPHLARKPHSHRDQEVSAEDDQQFLQRQLTIASSQAPAPVTAGTPRQASMPAGAVEAQLAAPVPKALGVGASPGGGVGAAAPGSQEGVLATFFNQLLTKKPAGPSPQKSVDSKPMSNEDAAAQLERIMAQNKIASLPTKDSANGQA